MLGCIPTLLSSPVASAWRLATGPGLVWMDRRLVPWLWDHLAPSERGKQLPSCVAYVGLRREQGSRWSSVFRRLHLRTGPRHGHAQQHTRTLTHTGGGEENWQIVSRARTLSLSVFVCLRQHKTSPHIQAVLNYGGGGEKRAPPSPSKFLCLLPWRPTP